MRDSRRKGRRLRRAGATFSLIGLMMTVFLAIGQVGLIAANADGWSDRSGDGSASAESGGRDDGFTVKASDAVSERSSAAKDAAAAPLEAARAVDVGDIALDWIAAGPYTYNHTTLAGTGPGLPEYDGRVIDKSTGVFESLEASDFNCNDKVVYFLALEIADDPEIDAPSTISVELSFDNEDGVGFRDFDNPAAFLNTDDAAYDGDATLTGITTNAPIAGNPPPGDLEISFDVNDVERGEFIVVQVVPILKCGGDGSPNGNLQARLDSMKIGNQNVPGSGTQTIPLKSARLLLEPDLTIVKSGPSEVGFGETITYEVTVQNIGTGPTTEDVIITDSVPAELSNVAATYSLNGGTDQVCTVNGNDVTCNVGILDGGDTVVVTITAEAPADSCPTVVNTASLSVGGATQDSNSVETVVTGCAPELSIDKEAVDETGAPVTEVSPGDGFSYVITVTNDGNEDATGVIVTDDLDDTLTIDSASYEIGAASGTCDIDATDNSIRCPQDPDAETLQPDESMVVTIDVTTAPDVCGALVNTAHVDWAEDETEEGLDSSQVTVDVTGCAPGLTISKTGPSSVALGGQITYTITVQNTGNAPTVGDVIVTDTVPAALSDVQASASPGTCTVVDNDVSCNVGVLAAAGSATVTITADAPSTVCLTVQNQAFVGELGSQIVTTTVTGCGEPPTPGIQIVKDGPATVHVGDTITYTFDVSLISGSPSLTNVTVTDPICDAGTLTGPTGDDGDAVLEQGETWGYTCTHVVTETDPDPLPNTATAEGHHGGTTVTDEDSHLVDIIHPAILVEKRARPQSGSPGEQITYHYTITNVGDVALHDISVDDDVIGHICDIAVLQPGESAECSKKYTLPDDGTISVTNVVVAEGEDPLGETVKDDDTETVDVILGQTVTKTPPAGPIAFTGTSSVIPLGALLLVFVTAGSALLWAGRRRGREASSE